MSEAKVKSLFSISATTKKNCTVRPAKSGFLIKSKKKAQRRYIVGVNVCSEDKPINYLIRAGAVISSSSTPETRVKGEAGLCMSRFSKLIALIANAHVHI